MTSAMALASARMRCCRSRHWRARARGPGARVAGAVDVIARDGEAGEWCEREVLPDRGRASPASACARCNRGAGSGAWRGGSALLRRALRPAPRRRAQHGMGRCRRRARATDCNGLDRPASRANQDTGQGLGRDRDLFGLWRPRCRAARSPPPGASITDAAAASRRAPQSAAMGQAHAGVGVTGCSIPSTTASRATTEGRCRLHAGRGTAQQTRLCASHGRHRTDKSRAGGPRAPVQWRQRGRAAATDPSRGPADGSHQGTLGARPINRGPPGVAATSPGVGAGSRAQCATHANDRIEPLRQGAKLGSEAGQVETARRRPRARRPR